MLVALSLTAAAAAATEPATLEVDTPEATAGFYQLRWFGTGPVELEEARDPDFRAPRVIYDGSDRARVMSGKPDGDFFYRIRNEQDGSYSNAVKVTVRHHSLARAFAFFSVGAIVFVATLFLIAGGARLQKAKPDG